MKIISKERIPSADCYKGLDYEDWVKLNGGAEVELAKIPDKLKDYVKRVYNTKEKEEE